MHRDRLLLPICLVFAGSIMLFASTPAQAIRVVNGVALNGTVLQGISHQGRTFQGFQLQGKTPQGTNLNSRSSGADRREVLQFNKIHLPDGRIFLIRY